MNSSTQQPPRPGLLIDLPWWYRPSLFLFGASLPALLLFANSDPNLTLSQAQLFYASRDTILGIAAIAVLIIGAAIGESGILQRAFRRPPHPRESLVAGTRFHGRLAASFLSPKIDWILMGIFIVSHLIFFRGFFMNPGLVAGVLGGNLELKHTFKTIPGITTWTQVTLLLAALRGLRWAGILPGKVKLISVFHLVLFGTLFIRAVLWSERLALIEGVVPFFLCATPRLIRMTGKRGKFLLQFFPLVVPILLLLVFTAFEFLRSWQSNASEHGNIFQFGWLRLFTYYFEAMNTGAATLQVTGFYETLTWPLSEKAYDEIFEGLYQGSLDIEFNNPSGIWYLATLSGNVLFGPVLLALGLFYGVCWRSFREGKLLGLFFPINFMGLIEIIRIHYWAGDNRVLASTLFILLILVWAAILPGRLRLRRNQDLSAPVSPPATLYPR